MTNLDWYKLRFNEDEYVKRAIRECRFCPMQKKCYAITRSECEKKLRNWCREDADED